MMKQIIKQNKGKLILSCIIILLPIVVGLLLWDKFPDTMTTHWGADGTANGFGSKAYAVFVLPCIMLVVHLICIAFVFADKKNRDQNPKVLNLIFWIAPFSSCYAGGIIYAASLGLEISIMSVTLAMSGLLFVFFGNYLPKCKQNSTLGIRIAWTLNDKENWDKTHRLAGKVWVIGGLMLLFTIFLPGNIALFVMFVGITILVAIPLCYSYSLHKKKKAQGLTEQTTIDEETQKNNALTTKIALGITIGITAIVVVTMFTGNITLHYGETSFEVEATYWSDLEVDYAAIESIEYLDYVIGGGRESGFGSARLELGLFENARFGRYTRYCYTSCDACVAMKVNGNYLAINGKDEAATKEIYEQLLLKIK